MLRTVMHFGVVIVLLIAIATLYNFNPETTLYPPCFFKKFTGFQCPGCGAARACYHLLHGNFLHAVSYNALLIFFLPIIFIDLLARLFATEKMKKLKAIPSYFRPIPVLFVVIVFWVVRNVPISPFTLLSSDH